MRGPFHIRRKVVKVCDLVLYMSYLVLFGELAEIYPMAPFSAHNNYGFSDCTPPTSGWRPLTRAEASASGHLGASLKLSLALVRADVMGLQVRYRRPVNSLLFAY